MASKRQQILSRKNLSAAGWLLAALLLVAGMGSEMMALLSAAPSPESQELRTARRNLRELEALTAGTVGTVGEAPKLDGVLIGAGGTSAASVAAGVSAGSMTAELLQEEVYTLPRLAGIVRIQHADGRVRYRAMLDGRDLGERGRVDGFTVQRISPTGVVLTKAGRQWSLPAPDAALTLRQQ